MARGCQVEQRLFISEAACVKRTPKTSCSRVGGEGEGKKRPGSESLKVWLMGLISETGTGCPRSVCAAKGFTSVIYLRGRFSVTGTEVTVYM